tara:strand:- start:123 stop:629 length:507 start_codon:yes stop_codon:yes gene_type:complete
VKTRQSLRLNHYDYATPGGYFLTICTLHRRCILTEPYEQSFRPNEFGDMIETVWFEQSSFYPGVTPGDFVVMPNHVHGILWLDEKNVLNLGSLVGRYKSVTTRRFKDMARYEPLESGVQKLWQRNYWEHVIRNESDLHRIREYIRDNPRKWNEDRLNPNGLQNRPHID